VTQYTTGVLENDSWRRDELELADEPEDFFKMLLDVAELEYA